MNFPTHINIHTALFHILWISPHLQISSPPSPPKNSYLQKPPGLIGGFTVHRFLEKAFQILKCAINPSWLNKMPLPLRHSQFRKYPLRLFGERQCVFLKALLKLLSLLKFHCLRWKQVDSLVLTAGFRWVQVGACWVEVGLTFINYGLSTYRQQLGVCSNTQVKQWCDRLCNSMRYLS